MSSSLALRQRQTISQSDCNMRRKVSLKKVVILYDNWRRPAQWLDWEAAPNHFLKPKLHQRKVMVTVWWSAACLIHYSFLSVQQIDEMHQKLQCLQLVLVNRRAQFFSTTSNRTSHNASKVERIGLWRFAYPPYSPDLSPNDYHFFKHLENFLQEKRFHNQQEAEDAFHEFVESWSTDFYATGIN